VSAILVVEDEPLILSMLALILKGNGFAVISASNGTEAMRKYHVNRRDIHLVICDADMPAFTGLPAMKQLLEERPDLPILLMSDDPDSAALNSPPAARFVSKPFDVSILLSIVRDMVTETNSVSAA